QKFMREFLMTVGWGAAAFVASNVDDLLLLVVFFASPGFHPRSIVAGQFVGMGALVAVSVVLSQLAIAFSAHWIAWLGLIPLLLGLVQLWKLVRGAQEDDAFTVEARYRHHQLLAVAGVTVANGADNISVYVPLFSRAPASIGACSVLFAIL